MSQGKTYLLQLSAALLEQVIYALMARKRELNNRPDLDSEMLVHTQAALDAAHAVKEKTK